MVSERALYVKIESDADIGQLKVGMVVYKYPLRGNPARKINLDEHNHSTFEVTDIEATYIVLASFDYQGNAAPLAKDFERLKAEQKWWYKKS